MTEVAAPVAQDSVSDAPASRIEEMKAMLAETSSENGAPSESGQVPAPVDLGEKPPETEEVEESEAAEKPADEAPAAEDPKKPTRYQRIRARAEQAEQRAAHAESERHQALTLGYQWKAEALALRQELARIAKETNYQFDPRDAELYAARRREEATQIQQQSAAEFEARQKQEAALQQQNQLADAYYEEADGLSRQFQGVTRKEILEAYAFSLQARRPLTMAQVAANLAKATGGGVKNPQVRQAQVNASVPSPIRSNRVSAGPKYGHSVNDMKAYLLSQKGG